MIVINFDSRANHTHPKMHNYQFVVIFFCIHLHISMDPVFVRIQFFSVGESIKFYGSAHAAVLFACF